VENKNLNGDQLIIQQILTDLVVEKTVVSSKNLASSIHLALKSNLKPFQIKDRGHKAGKLVPLRLPELALDRVPAPYPAVLNIIAHGDDDALTRALKRLGLLQAPQ
jgi:hypothetical protein